jgi:hypothetical protein
MPRKRKKNAKPRLARVRIEAEARPEPDWDRYGWALLTYAKTLMAREAAEASKPDEPS